MGWCDKLLLLNNSMKARNAIGGPATYGASNPDTARDSKGAALILDM